METDRPVPQSEADASGIVASTSAANRSPLRRQLRTVLICLLLVGFFALLAAGLCLFLKTRVFQPIGSISEEAATLSQVQNQMGPEPILIFLILLALLIAPLCTFAGAVCLVLKILRPTRWTRMRGAGIVFFTIALAFVEMSIVFYTMDIMVFRKVFLSAFYKTAERAQPLVDSIEAYRLAKGEYPPELDCLVPEFLPEIPSTGLAGYPTFEYCVPDDNEDGFETYELLINTSSGVLNWDVFVYWPEGAYPEHFYGGRRELIDGWAYVHE